MKNKILSLLIVLFSMFSWNIAFTQFSSDKVLIYVKAGVDPSKVDNIHNLGKVLLIGYFAYDDEITNDVSYVREIRELISSNSKCLTSPYSILEIGGSCCSSFNDPKICKYDSDASTSKYRVYSGYSPAGKDFFGGYKTDWTCYYAFSKDWKKLIVWKSRWADKREIYLLTDPSEFNQTTSTPSNYDFLE